MKRFRVTVEGKTYEVLVEAVDEAEGGATPATVARPRPAVSPGPGEAQPAESVKAAAELDRPAVAGAVPSPLSGKVVAVAVTVGSAVTVGTEIATIEAMKMNTHIFAPTAGRVAAIFVKPGDGVEEGTALLQIE